MKIWLIQRNDSVDYDEARGAVINADTADEVRQIAAYKAEGAQDNAVRFVSADVDVLGEAVEGAERGIVLVDLKES
jgi:hypothetical protein